MLPAIPKIEELRGRSNLQLVQRLSEQFSPILGEIKRNVQFEGRQATLLRHDDTIGETSLHRVKAETGVLRMELTVFTEEELLERLRHLAEQLARGLSENLTAELDAATTRVGNVVDAGGQPISEELILKALEKMDHTFEPDGTWIPPTLLASPAAIERLKEGAEGNVRGSKEFDQALKSILEKKRDEFHRREADRILAG